MYTTSYEYTTLADQINTFYKLNPEAEKINPDDLEDFFRIAEVSEDIRSTAGEVFACQEGDVTDVLKHVRDKKILHNLNKLIQNQQASDEIDLSEVKAALEEDEEDDTDEDSLVTLKLGDILRNREGFLFQLPSLQEIIGPVGGGDTIIVFAPVETGKTGFMIDSGGFFLQQGARVLHINNEDAIHRVLERYYINFFGFPKDEIYTNIEKYSTKFEEEFSESLLIVNDTGLGVSGVDALAKKYQPNVVIIDQADGLVGDQDVKILNELYKELRKVGHRRDCTMMLATQAGGGTGTWPGMEDIYGSKVVKQANVDVIIGIGTGGPFDELNKRYFSISKNKLLGKHSKFTASYDQTLMRYMEH